MKILVIRLSALGDIVHSLPAVNLIKKVYPQANIDWLVYEKFSSILGSQKIINRIHKLKDKKLSTLVQAALDLRKEKYDLVIDMQGLLKTSFMAALIAAFNEASEAKKVQILGPAYPRETHSQIFYSQKADNGPLLSNDSHVIEKNLAFAQFLGAKLDYDSSGLPILDYGLTANAQNDKNKASSMQVCIIPCTTWESKFWRKDYWANVIEDLCIKRGAKIYLLGAKADEKYFHGILDELKAINFKNFELVQLVTNKKLDELVDFFSNMDLVLGVDTGPLHIAAASLYKTNKRIIGLYGPSSGARTGPYSFENLSYDELFGQKASHKRTVAADAASMQLISPQKLLEKIYSRSA